jgi:hypothetical protein
MAKSSGEARVLLNHDGFKINSIISGDDAARGVAEGWADADPAAVAHAKSVSVDAPSSEEVHEAADEAE